MRLLHVVLGSISFAGLLGSASARADAPAPMTPPAEAAGPRAEAPPRRWTRTNALAAGLPLSIVGTAMIPLGGFLVAAGSSGCDAGGNLSCRDGDWPLRAGGIAMMIGGGVAALAGTIILVKIPPSDRQPEVDIEARLVARPGAVSLDVSF